MYKKLFYLVTPENRDFLLSNREGKVQKDKAQEVVQNYESKHNLEIWHRRLGHPSYSVIHNTNKNTNYSLGKLSEEKKSCAECDVCIKGKMTKIAYKNKSSRTANKPLEIIECDLKGPLDVVSFSGNTYYNVTKDRYTKILATEAIKRKEEGSRVLKDNLIEWENVQNHDGHKVIEVDFDGGGEYKSKELRDWFKQKGIKFQETCSESSNQNAGAERAIRTVNDIMITLLVGANAAEYFWDEALQYATILNNIIIHQGYSKSPYYMFHKKDPDLHRIKVWGCKVMVKTNIKKAIRASRSLPAVLSGRIGVCLTATARLAVRDLLGR